MNNSLVSAFALHILVALLLLGVENLVVVNLIWRAPDFAPECEIDSETSCIKVCLHLSC